MIFSAKMGAVSLGRGSATATTAMSSKRLRVILRFFTAFRNSLGVEWTTKSNASFGVAERLTAVAREMVFGMGHLSVRGIVSGRRWPMGDVLQSVDQWEKIFDPLETLGFVK